MKFQNAWISDRTLCYLASGKPRWCKTPAKRLPAESRGLFRFSTLPEAADAFEKINSDYERHSRAARRIAETFFDAKEIARTILSHALV